MNQQNPFNLNFSFNSNFSNNRRTGGNRPQQNNSRGPNNQHIPDQQMPNAQTAEEAITKAASNCPPTYCPVDNCKPPAPPCPPVPPCPPPNHPKPSNCHPQPAPCVDHKTSCAVNDKKDHSLTVGCDGPVLLHDTILHETLEIFVNEKIIERAVHTKGYGAFGYFITYQSMKKYTKACIFQNQGQKTVTFTRFSLAVSTKGTPDTYRNVRGFSTKFYTNEGTFDLLMNHIPVFLIRDAMKFPKAIKSLSPSPINNLSSPISFWRFVAENPEAMNFVTWLYSDLGTIDSFRHMRGYGVNTYIWENAECQKWYVKYHWIPLAGETCGIDRCKAIKLAGENPDIAGQDLFNTIACGKCVEYELCVQLMEPCCAENLCFDPLDATKIWDIEEFPLVKVGKLVLDRNVENYQCQVEKSAFSPSNLLEGIYLSSDKLLQGRATIYWDAQRRRLGPDFRDIPVNHEEKWSPKLLVTSQEGEWIHGRQIREGLFNPDNFIQAGEHYRCLCQEQQDNLIDNIACELYAVPLDIQKCVLGYFALVDIEFKNKIVCCMDHYKCQKR